jgi:hypothetical protein
MDQCLSKNKLGYLDRNTIAVVPNELGWLIREHERVVVAA